MLQKIILIFGVIALANSSQSRVDQLTSELRNIKKELCRFANRDNLFMQLSNNYEYHVSDYPLPSQEDAMSYCQSKDAQLAYRGFRSIDIRSKIESHLLVVGRRYWIGLNDKAHEGRYLWEDGATLKTTEQKWLSGEPNNYKGREDCTVVDTWDQMRWNDVHCWYDRAYAVCERPWKYNFC